MTNTEQVVEDPQVYSVQVTDVDTFIGLLTDWHRKQVATVMHLKEVPEGTEVSTEGEDNLTLSGDVLRAFKLGIGLSLSYLSELPFAVEYVEPEPVPVV